jgi:hypothetical protein
VALGQLPTLRELFKAVFAHAWTLNHFITLLQRILCTLFLTEIFDQSVDGWMVKHLNHEVLLKDVLECAMDLCEQQRLAAKIKELSCKPTCSIPSTSCQTFAIRFSISILDVT